MTTLLSITPDQMYLFLNFGVMPFWALIIFLPMLKITDTLVHSVLAPIVLGVTYAWLLANVMGGVIQMPEGAGFASLDALIAQIGHDCAETRAILDA